MENVIRLAKQDRKIPRGFLILLALCLAIVVSFRYLEISIPDLVMGGPAFISFFVSKFLLPDFTNIAQYIPAVMDTVLFAIVGTYISTFLAFVLGLLMSEISNPIMPLRFCARAFVSFLRNIPVLIWASLLVYAFGIGEIVGLLALIIATLGFLSRSYSDSINEVAGSKLEALRASGASYLQIMWHGLLPNFVPSLINWTLFAFEINIRASTILGMVGAGGIGILIQTNIKLFRYREACAIIIIVVCIVLLTEFATNQIRKRIR